MVLLVANIITLSVCIMLDIFMVSYFLTKQRYLFFIFFLNVSEILILLFYCAFSGGVKTWKSSSLAVRKIQVSPRHISAYVCIYTELYKPAIFDRD